MKNLYMIMRDGADIKVLPYEEGNALPVVYAENEAKAKTMAEEIVQSMNMAHFQQVVDERLEDMKEYGEEGEYDFVDDNLKESLSAQLWDGLDGTEWDDARFLIDWERDERKEESNG